MTILQDLESRLATALESVVGEPTRGPVTPAADLRFGDYQSNAAMVLAKQRKTNPRALAQEIIDKIDLSGLATAEIAGPGFLNFRILPEAFASRATAMLNDEKLGVPNIGAGKTVVVDFSSPNVAKPMHIGHIRSTIIGDSLGRVARFLGFNVIADNHIGDWGTQFGMILYGWKNLLNHDALEVDPIAELVRVYREVNAATKDNPELREECKNELVRLQTGDPENTEIWLRCIDLSKLGLQKIYDRLDVHFDYWLGESFYNDRLGSLVEEFLEKDLARVSNGAVCVFSGGTKKLEEDPFQVHREEGWVDNPSIIRKADGGFLYATTDLATIEYRIDTWKADHVWYVVGVPQQLHFRQLFDAAERWGKSCDFQHVAFGSILGEDRKMLRTRSGENVGLIEVLEEAVERAAAAIAEKNPDLGAEEAAEIAETVGIGAVKFAELSQNRLTDYVFSWERMLALQGDTAPYLQYSNVRIRSIFRKLEQPFDAANASIVLTEDQEIHLARLLVRFGEVVPTVLDDFRPNLLANYLLELARAFHSFFEACPVLKAEGVTRASRLALCDLAAKTLGKGLDLLGIKVPERM
ncbi:arginine--tRNA ligase [Luteolibacter pohnpeiensis]|uniref:Arginine--tRNA ligase n=1 Tax=Luteolibacter pohnpeiensis TaxID=454153 RepID=A0A934VWV0_9BACT|nr:arginine--tRNA ligase [Luteolibacter pohnpeiensis]MBK1882904.1 arginine--tRNA ligase [Luteolibacter pohnpeiensis]